MPIDMQALRRRLDTVNTLIRSHAGEVEVVSTSDDGTVVLRYTGMCAGCEYRPATTAGTVEPALLALPGVTKVVVQGSAVSEEAAHRIARTVTDGAAAERAVRVVERIEALAKGDEE